jgi:hypothetical protein
MDAVDTFKGESFHKNVIYQHHWTEYHSVEYYVKSRDWAKGKKKITNCIPLSLHISDNPLKVAFPKVFSLVN